MIGLLLILTLSLASLRVWTVIIRRWRAGEPLLEAAPPCPSPWLPVLSVLAAVYVGLAIATGADPSAEVDLKVVQTGVAMGAAEIIIAVILLTGGFRARLADVGLPLGNLTRQLGEGTLAFLASIGPVFVVLLVTYVLRTEETLHPYLRLLRDDRSPLTFGWLVLAAVVVAPVREELLFRVILQDGMARTIGAAPAIGVVAVLFSAVHGFPDSLALIPLALILGYVYQQRQSGLTVMVTHALFNLTNLTLLLVTSDPVSP